jgi:hypothetical protein
VRQLTGERKKTSQLHSTLWIYTRFYLNLVAKGRFMLPHSLAQNSILLGRPNQAVICRTVGLGMVKSASDGTTYASAAAEHGSVLQAKLYLVRDLSCFSSDGEIVYA